MFNPYTYQNSQPGGAAFMEIVQRRGSDDGGLALYIGDRPEPRARMRLRDVLNLGGRRPLHVRIRSRQAMRLVMRNVRSG